MCGSLPAVATQPTPGPVLPRHTPLWSDVPGVVSQVTGTPPIVSCGSVALIIDTASENCAENAFAPPSITAKIAKELKGARRRCDGTSKVRADLRVDARDRPGMSSDRATIDLKHGRS
jgi:hypothetical protein